DEPAACVRAAADRGPRGAARTGTGGGCAAHPGPPPRGPGPPPQNWGPLPSGGPGGQGPRGGRGPPPAPRDPGGASRRPRAGAAASSCAAAPRLAGEPRRAGLRAVVGPVVSTPRLVRGAGREQLAAGGALAADLESAGLLTAAADRPAIVVRAVSDTAARPL